MRVELFMSNRSIECQVMVAFAAATLSEMDVLMVTLLNIPMIVGGVDQHR